MSVCLCMLWYPDRLTANNRYSPISPLRFLNGLLSLHPKSSALRRLQRSHLLQRNLVVQYLLIILVPLSLSVPGNSYEDPRSNSGFFLHPTDSNLIYMYGGISAYGPLSDLWTYNTATHTWSYLLTFDSFYPLKYNSYTAFRYNAVDYFCIYGGKNILGYTNQIYL